VSVQSDRGASCNSKPSEGSTTEHIQFSSVSSSCEDALTFTNTPSFTHKHKGRKRVKTSTSAESKGLHNGALPSQLDAFVFWGINISAIFELSGFPPLHSHTLKVHAKRDGSGKRHVMKSMAAVEHLAMSMHCRSKPSTQGGAIRYVDYTI